MATYSQAGRFGPAVVSGAPVGVPLRVLDASGSDAVLYADASKNKTVGPVVYSNDAGQVTFFADPGTYTLRWTGGSASAAVSGGEADMVQSPSASRLRLPAFQALQSRVDSGQEDVVVLALGDSTTRPLLDTLYPLIKNNWPTHSFEVRLIDENTGLYGAPAVHRVGTGPRKITFYDASRGSTTIHHSIGKNLNTAVIAIQPHLVLVNHGHNQDISDANGRERAISEMLNLTEVIGEACPGAEIALLGQTPWSTQPRGQLSNQYWAELCAMRGYTFVGGAMEAFLNDSRWALGTNPGGLLTDYIHPNAAGNALWASVVAPYFDPDLLPAPARSRQISTLLTYRENVLSNDLSTYSGGTPDGWTLVGTPTVTADATVFENAVRGRSLKLLAPGSGAAALSTMLDINKVRGEVITVAARIYVPATGSSDASGQIRIIDDGGTSQPSDGIVTAWGKDAWRWQVFSKRISPTATSVEVQIRAASGANAGLVYIDRVGVSLGRGPARWIRTNPQVDVFTANGTWTKPAGAKTVQVQLIAGGSGGGSGRRGAAGTVRCGGGGGGGGAMSLFTMPASNLPAAATVTIGSGGAGGAAVTADDTNGTAGSAGGNTIFSGTGVNLRATAGGGGGGGTSSAGSAGAGGGIGTTVGGIGGSASGTGGVATQPSAAAGPSGGGAGGGITSADSPSAGIFGGSSMAATASGGAVGGALPSAGTSQPAGSGLPGSGAGGGAASITGAAQAGAIGGLYGAGGGGGGASLNGNASGAGGDGAPGIAVVTTYF